MNRPPARRGGRDTTQGPILGALVALAVPIVATNLFQTLYQLIDTFWVGRLGAEAVAAVSLSFPVLFLLISLGGGMAVAGAILVAQNFGAGESDAVDHAAGQTLMVVFTISVALSVAGYFLAAPLMRVFRPSPVVGDLATTYLKISFLGLVAVFIYFVFQALLRGVGDVKTPMIVVAGTVVLNMVMDPFLIMGWGPFPELGVAGAAWATIISQGLAGVLGMVILFSGRYGLHLRWRHLPLDRHMVRTIVRLGVPSSLEQSTRALGITVMVVLVAGFGTTVLASYGIVGRMLSFVIIPAMGLAMATSTVVGQNVGARQKERAKNAARIGMAAVFIALTGAGLLLFLFARPVVHIFIPTDPEVVEIGGHFLRVMALTFGFMGVQMVMSGALSGAGNTLAAMGLSIMVFWIFRFPLAWFLSTRTSMGVDGLWWAFPISNVLSAMVSVTWFLRGTWIRRVVEDAELVEAVREAAIVEEGVGEA